MPLTRLLRLWFRFDDPVDRRVYLASGLFLAVIKYAGDVVIMRVATGQFWHPLDYLNFAALNPPMFSTLPPAVVPALALWSIPFLWVGISMSMRRSLDAGESAWYALFFFVPLLRYVFIARMCLMPSQPQPAPSEPARPYEARLPSALLSMAAGAVLGLGMLALSVYGLRAYGATLFLGTPFMIGAITAFLFNRRYPASASETQQVVLMTQAIVGGVLLMTAAEGAVCLFMAAPLAIGIGWMGASLGRQIALLGRSTVNGSLAALLFLPVGALIDARQPATALREVRSAIEINAPPDIVWRNVISFPPLPEPSDLVFRAGISYPKRAEIVGEGVGAIRYCVFSTGAFVEPITQWDPGHRLSFNVVEQPKPMHEWSPYADISPPHLDGYFRSRRGEFRLIALPGGRTRLEGSTWYEMTLQPAAYWVLFGDALIHRIHGRVLEHIRSTAERSASGY